MTNKLNAAVAAQRQCAEYGERHTDMPDSSKTGAWHRNGALPGERAWIELDRSALRHNADALRSVLSEGCELMPAVKADAYGHGAVLISRELNAVGVKAFCVATAIEGVELRMGGVKGEILVLGYTHPEQFELLQRYHLMQTVLDCDYAGALNSFGAQLEVHIAVDTGMRRLGERSERIDDIMRIFDCENLCVKGMFTHLCADSTRNQADMEFTLRQERMFRNTVRQLRRHGYTAPKLHAISSYTLLNYPELAGDYARVGIALYGMLSTGADTEKCSLPLKPVLSLKARVAQVKKIYAGEPAGYDMAYTAEKNGRLAVLTIGYADGVPRELSCGVGGVLINGEYAPVAGRICMDQMMVDVSDITNVKAGDTAVIIGKSGEREISACDIAGQTDTIANEVLSRLGKRLEHIIF